MPWQIVPARSFAEHAPAWDCLLRHFGGPPFMESAFIVPLLEVFGDGSEVLALLQEQGALQAAALLQPRGRGRWETFQPSQLPLGPWIGDGDSLCGRMDDLLRRLPGLALALGLTQLDPRFHPRPAPGSSLRLLDYIDTSFIEIAGDFDTYWEGRGKNLRQNTRKQRNKLQAEGIQAQLECTTDPDGVAPAIADYGALESAGWKADTGTAIHPDNAQGRFYRSMLEAFCRMGRGRIYRYRFGGKVVAMDLCIDDGPQVVILKTAYDESLKQFSPSTLMRQEQFKAWWAEGRYRRIEFYGKTLEWHTRWTDRSRTLYHATAYRWPWLARVAASRSASADPIEASAGAASPPLP
ncbi:MAG: GNAT family N-acetyltransferase [Halioglobus sp.]|nr:GNAT family N-acetyltransferase [Halioglobus sp.]